MNFIHAGWLCFIVSPKLVFYQVKRDLNLRDDTPNAYRRALSPHRKCFEALHSYSHKQPFEMDAMFANADLHLIVQMTCPICWCPTSSDVPTGPAQSRREDVIP